MLYQVVQIQPRKLVLDHADCMAPTRQHELDHTYQEFICPEGSRSRSVEINHTDDLSGM